MCHILSMIVLNARQLHNETSAVLDEVSKGKAFQIVRNGKLIGTLQPADEPAADEWAEIMAEVWSAKKNASGKTCKPVMAIKVCRSRCIISRTAPIRSS